MVVSLDCMEAPLSQQCRREGWDTSTAMAPPCMRSGRVACAQSPTPVRQPSNQDSPALTGLQDNQSIVKQAQRTHGWPLGCRQIMPTLCCVVHGYVQPHQRRIQLGTRNSGLSAWLCFC